MPNKKQWLDVELEVVKRTLEAIGGDGHSILPLDYYEGLGIPIGLIKDLERTFESDFSHPKSTIFDHKGEAVKEMKGIKTADVLGQMADGFPCDPDLIDEARSKMGRSSCAQGLTAAIWKVISPSGASTRSK